MVNVGTAIEKAWSKFADNSTTLREKMVGWFNEVARDILNQPRQWFFLQSGADISIVNDTITLPAGVREVLSIKIGETLLTSKNHLSLEEADGYSGSTNNDTVGYTVSPGKVITLYPGGTGTATVRYTTDLAADYADLAATIFPDEMMNLFVAGLRLHYYDYMKDGRFTKEAQMYNYEMNNAKAWDNRRKLQWHGISRVGSGQGTFARPGA